MPIYSFAKKEKKCNDCVHRKLSLFFLSLSSFCNAAVVAVVAVAAAAVAVVAVVAAVAVVAVAVVLLCLEFMNHHISTQSSFLC